MALNIVSGKLLRRSGIYLIRKAHEYVMNDENPETK